MAVTWPRCSPAARTAVLSHRSAAASTASADRRRAKIDVTFPRRPPPARGIEVHRSTTLTDEPTSPSSTASLHDRRAHAARPRRRSPRRAVERAFDQAESSSSSTSSALNDQLDRDNHTRRAVPKPSVRPDEHHHRHSTPTESSSRRALLAITRGRHPAPERQSLDRPRRRRAADPRRLRLARASADRRDRRRPYHRTRRRVRVRPPPGPAAAARRLARDPRPPGTGRSSRAAPATMLAAPLAPSTLLRTRVASSRRAPA